MLFDQFKGTNMNFRKTVLALSVLGAVGMTGCGGSSHKHPQLLDVTISGAAAKGLIFGGIVNIHPIINGALSDTSLVDGTTSTDDGTYSVQIADYDGSPFIVRVSAADDGSTTMRCDLAGGCGGGVNFGGVVTIDDADFNLDAIVPPVTDPTAQINLSVLTDTATSVALDALATGGDTTLEAAITAIANANSSIANRFGITGDITTLPIVDLTNPAAVAAASNNTLDFNLLSAGIVEALMDGDPVLSIAAAVQAFATQFVSDGGLADTENVPSTTVTLAEILAQASSIIDAIDAEDTEGLVDLTVFQDALDDEAVDLDANGSTEPDPGTPDSEGGDSGSGGSGGSGGGSI